MEFKIFQKQKTQTVLMFLFETMVISIALSSE